MTSQKTVEKKQSRKKSVEIANDVYMKDEMANDELMKEETQEEIKDDTTDLSLLAFNKMIEAKFKPNSNSDE